MGTQKALNQQPPKNDSAKPLNCYNCGQLCHMEHKCRNIYTSLAQAHLTITEEQSYTAMITEINTVGRSDG